MTAFPPRGHLPVLALGLTWVALGCTETRVVGILDSDGAVSDGSSDAQADADNPGLRREICGNGADDDTDTQIDEGCWCAPGESQSCFRGVVAMRDIGVCDSGQQACGGATNAEFGTWGECEGQGRPEASETCDDQLDNDCDGSVDEGCAGCTPQTQRRCGERTQLPCEEGVQTCRGDGTWSRCQGVVVAQPEICGNRVDDDCNGIVDDTCDCVPTGVEECGNRLDDDCDGVTDEPACCYIVDDFEGGDLGSWLIEDGEWDLATEGTQRLRGRSLQGGARIIRGSTAWTDYSIDVITRARVAPAGGYAMSVFARYQDPDHLYRFHYSPGFGGWAIFKRSPGTWEQLALSDTADLPLEEDYRVHVEVRGSELSLSVGGSLMATATDPEYGNGSIGLNVYMGEGLFDELRVCALGSVDGTPQN